MPGPPRLTVLGSLNMDISVAVTRLPAPGETVLGSTAVIAPGGKGANQAVAAARLGGAVRMAGCVGADDFGAALVAALSGERVDVGAVRTVPGWATGLALITVDATGENVIAVAPGANGLVGAAEVVAALADPCDLLILSAEIPVEVLRAALAGARDRGLACLLNLAPAPPEAAQLLAGGVDWLVVNESEAAAVLRHEVTGLADARSAARQLCGLGALHAVVTAGSQGAALAGGEGETGDGSAAVRAGVSPDGGADDEAVPGFAVRSIDAVGAGDAFVAALGVTLAAGLPAGQAVRAGCAAGAAATTRRGTQEALPRPGEILAATGLAWPLGPA